ncbi:hypothetical protein [uncultured Aquimarina sp.]|uniref:hypothetical protein n=1 Tax=uncultured Aquimarina sp. TaxID=575652 RepID=UPI0026237566|nr:hypothetical protein [uncultured Aquimarina sp.]
MKKIVNILLIGTFLFLFQNCSYDESEIFEEDLKLIEEYNGKNFSNNNTGNEGYLLEGCEIEYTFNDPTLTPSQKAAIRNSYNFFLGIKSVNGNTEIWYTDCLDFLEYNQANPGGDTNGTYVLSGGCPRGGCPSTPPAPDEPTDPFGSDQ